jgi:hypothetical protein
MNNRKITWEELNLTIEEYKKDPEFRKDLREFIRVTSQ